MDPIGWTAPELGNAALAHVDAEGVIQEVILPLPPASGPFGPFRNRPKYSIVPRVGRAAVAMASLEGPDAGTFSLVTVDLKGDTALTRRYAFRAEEIPKEVADSVLELYTRQRESMTGQVWDPPAGAAPPMYPPFVDLVIGEDGSVWIRHRLREGRRRYYVVAPGGEPMGTVSLPGGNRIAAARLERAWVIHADELGVESVVRYGVEWN